MSRYQHASLDDHLSDDQFDTAIVTVAPTHCNYASIAAPNEHITLISTLAFQFLQVSPPGQPLETNKYQETGKLGNPCLILWNNGNL